MKRHTFQLLPPASQMYWVLTRGTCVARRWSSGAAFVLYYLPNKGRGFFAELGIDQAKNCFVVLRSFSSSVPLEDYVVSLHLPEGL